MKRPPARHSAPMPMPRFADRLQDGECLLWEGRPSLHWFLWPKLMAGSLLLLPFLPPLLYLESLRGGTPLVWLSFKTVFVGSLAFLGMIAFLYQQGRAQAQTAAYAISNRRIFIRRLERLTSQDWRPRIDEIPLQSVQPGLRPLGGGFGTITLGAPLWNYEKALRGIPNAAAVFALLTEALAAVPEARTAEASASGPYYVSRENAAQPAAAWTPEEALRRGETVLWQGGVNAQADLRAGWWAIPFLALVMAALGGWILSWLGNWTWLWQSALLAGSLAIVLPIARRDGLTVSGRPTYVLTNRRVLIVKNAGKSGQKLEERELPPSVVTRSIAQLEDHLGITVLSRTTRSVRVTERGRIYLERCEQILDDVRGAERLARGEDAELRGELTIAAPVMFGRLRVLPVVSALLAAHRGLAIRLVLSDRNAHLVDDGVDLAVRIGELADSAAIAVKLATVSRVVVASPAYLAARGTPKTPADLATHDIIAFESIELTNEWRFRDDKAARVTPRLTVNSADAAIAAAESGLGITRALSYQIQASVRAGRLVALLPNYAPPDLPVHALYATRRAAATGVAAFVAAARAHFEASPRGKAPRG